MWCRTVEVMLGCWLAMSPFIFGHPPEETAWWVNDLACAAAIVTLSLVSFYRPLRYAHLLQLIVGLWLVGFGYLQSPAPAPPSLQNDMFVGMTLLMFAILPDEADQPPVPWREWRRARAGSEGQTPS